VALNPDLNKNDLLHPNAEGVEILVGKTLPVVEQFIQKQTKPESAP
jgi:hypothetical protein